MYISRISGGTWEAKTSGRIEPDLLLMVYVITCFTLGDDRFRGLASAEGQISPFPIDFDGRPLPSESCTISRTKVAYTLGCC